MIIPQFIKQFIWISDASQKIDYVEILMWKIHPQTIEVVWFLVILTVLAGFFELIFNFASMRLSEYTISHIRHIIRMNLFKKLITLSKEDVEEITYATIITRFGNDINKINGGFFVLCRSFANGLFLLVWGFIFALLTSLSLSIAILITLPFFFIGSVFAIRKIFPYYRKENIVLDKLNARAKEDINGIELIKAYNLESFRANEYQKENNELFDIGWKSIKISGTAWPLINFAVSFGNVIVYLILGLTAAKFTNANIGTYVSNAFLFGSYLQMISFGVFQICFESNKLFRAGVSSKRVFELQNIESSISKVVSDRKIKNGKIEFKNVTFAYRDNPNNKVIDNLSFSIPANTSVGIIGKTGSGKSTLTNLLLREVLPQNGSIYIDNQNINEIDTENYYGNISAVFQKPMLLSGSISNNLSFALENEDNFDSDKFIQIASADFINEYETKTNQIIGQHGINLSGGQKQRVAIAQGIAKEPKILILDDTTSALDNKTDYQVRQNILNNFKNITLVVVAQRIKSIQKLDKILVLDKGKLVGEGTHEDLLKNNSYYQEIYKSQKES